jgi:alkylation response protein AidB-like acyl-CoA dehydrogenase
MLFPRASATIREDSWNVVGLRGTGSDTYSVTDLAVPAAHAIVARATPQAGPNPERREQGALYRFSAVNVYQCGFAAVALGLARAMLNDFVALAKKKTPASGLPLREDHTIQARIALSEARLGSARAFILQILGEMQAECVSSGQIGMENRIRLRLASTHAIQEARQVVEDSYADAGATAIFEAGPFERRLRDMHAVSQQIQASASHYQSVGQYYLGLQPNTRFI